MKITRRQFHTGAGSCLALTALSCAGCDRLAAGWPTTHPADENTPSDLATAPFLIGPLSHYAQAGLYKNFRRQGVWIVSDGRRLIVLSAVCTHLQCLVKWDPAAHEFACPCHHSHFKLDGTPLPHQKADSPLERCRLTLVKTPTGPQVQVDPTFTFTDDELGDEFGKPGAYLSL